MGQLKRYILYEQKLKNAMYPIISGAYDAHQSIPGFEAEYDSLVSNTMNTASHRLNTYLTVVTLAADSSSSTKEKVIAYIDTCLNSINRLTTQVDHVLNLVSQNVQLDASIAAFDLTQTARILSMGEENAITFKVKNFGGVATSDVKAKIELGPGLSAIGTDSIQIGDLLPGQESEEISFKVAFNTDTLERTIWSIYFTSAIGRSFASRGVIFKSDNASNFSKLSAKSDIICFPNPSHHEVFFNIKMQKSQRVRIEIYNQLGQLVSYAFDKKLPRGDHKLKIETINLRNGTYFFKIRNGDSQMETKKIIVINPN